MAIEALDEPLSERLPVVAERADVANPVNAARATDITAIISDRTARGSDCAFLRLVERAEEGPVNAGPNFAKCTAKLRPTQPSTI